MEILTQARHFDLSQSTRTYCEEKVERLTRYTDQILGGTVTITKEKFRYTAQIALKVGSADLVSKEETADLRTAVDGAVDRLESQICKLKGRQQSGRNRGEKVGSVLAAEEEAERAAREDEDETTT